MICYACRGKKLGQIVTALKFSYFYMYSFYAYHLIVLFNKYVYYVLCIRVIAMFTSNDNTTLNPHTMLRNCTLYPYTISYKYSVQNIDPYLHSTYLTISKYMTICQYPKKHRIYMSTHSFSTTIHTMHTLTI
jgi:hypothetical protein